MFYPVSITKLPDGKIQGVMDDSGAVAVQDTEDEVIAAFVNSSSGIIENEFRKKKRSIPLPREPREGDLLVYVPLQLQLRIALWNIMRSQRITTAELGRILGISRQYAQRYVNGSDLVSVENYERALTTLGYFSDLSVTHVNQPEKEQS